MQIAGRYALDVSTIQNVNTTDTWLAFNSAKLCLDCEGIFASPTCPACSSANYVPVSRWIQPIESSKGARPAPALVPGKTIQATESFLRTGVYVALGIFIGKLLSAAASQAAEH